MTHTHAPSVTAPHPEAAARPGFFRRCLSKLAGTSGFALTMFPMETPHMQRLTAQEQAAGNIALLMMQRAALEAEHARLRKEIALAVKQHRSATSLDKRLRLVTAQLVSIG